MSEISNPVTLALRSRVVMYLLRNNKEFEKETKRKKIALWSSWTRGAHADGQVFGVALVTQQKRKRGKKTGRGVWRKRSGPLEMTKHSPALNLLLDL